MNKIEAKETGYIINKKYQRMSYATEAIKALIKSQFNSNIHRIFAECVF